MAFFPSLVLVCSVHTLFAHRQAVSGEARNVYVWVCMCVGVWVCGCLGGDKKVWAVDFQYVNIPFPML